MSRQHSDVDELFDVKNNYYIGNLQQCINEAQNLKLSMPDLQLERDFFMYRAYVAQRKFRIVLDEIKETSSEEIKPVKLLAEYFAFPDTRANIVAKINNKVHNLENKPIILVIIAATIYFHENSLENALRLIYDVDNLECKALCVQTLLRMDRFDLAVKEVKSMQETDDDATLTQLALAWINIANGPDKCLEGFYIYQEMIDKYSPTTMLLNGKATCLILQGKHAEAENVLQDSLEKDSNNPDTLINIIVLSQHLSKPDEVINRYLTELKDSHQEHPFVRDYLQKEHDFETFSTLFQT